jgi:hypothetical protein
MGRRPGGKDAERGQRQNAERNATLLHAVTSCEDWL